MCLRNNCLFVQQLKRKQICRESHNCLSDIRFSLGKFESFKFLVCHCNWSISIVAT